MKLTDIITESDNNTISGPRVCMLLGALTAIAMAGSMIWRGSVDASSITAFGSAIALIAGGGAWAAKTAPETKGDGQ